MSNKQHLNNVPSQNAQNYLKFRVTGIDQDGRFIDYPIVKIRTTEQLKEWFNRLSHQVHSIHKIYLKCHTETKIVIGIDIQAKETFDYQKFLSADISAPLYLPRKYDELVNYKHVWATVKYCLLRDREILKTVCNPKRNTANASDDDKFRHNLRKQNNGAVKQPTIVYKSKRGA